MGITGLLPALKSITETKALEEYRGKTIAIDGYVWLHRAIYSCSQEICLGQETDKYINYFMERVDMLIHNGITPYVVFDGGPLPMKKGTELERRALRLKNRNLGVQLYNQGAFADARKHFVRAADVSPFMAHRVIQHLKARSVDYVVAPYEADAQLAFLVQSGLADGVITEDSDCIPFGCHTVLFKLDKDGVGLVQEIQEANLPRNTGLLFHSFTPDMFLEMCIFSGCDYLPSLAGFGLKKAYAALKHHGSFVKVIRALRLEGKVRIPLTYEADFANAVQTFRHQRVFDPTTQRLVHLTPVRDASDDADDALAFLGPMLADDIAIAIAQGDMDPITMERFPLSPTTTLPIVTTSTFETSKYGRVAVAAAKKRKPVSPLFAAQLALQAQQQQQGRQLPPTLVGAMLQAHPSASSVLMPPATDAPVVVSRFFATASHQSMSAGDDGDDTIGDGTATPSAVPLSSFESQEPVDVDVAQSITLTPAVDAKTLGHSSDKENHTPPPCKASASSVAPTPVVKENAFARMMRAGSALQKQSLKRKAAAGALPTHRHAKQLSSSGGLFNQPYRPVATTQRTHVDLTLSNSSSSVVVSTVETARYLTRDPAFEAATDATTVETEPEIKRSAANDIEVDCESQSNSSKNIVARGAYLQAAAAASLQSTPSSRGKVVVVTANSTRMLKKRTVQTSTTPSTSSAVVASLDRFRFKQ